MDWVLCPWIAERPRNRLIHGTFADNAVAKRIYGQNEKKIGNAPLFEA